PAPISGVVRADDPRATTVATYLFRRLLALLPVMLVVVTVVFLLIHLIPGDPVAVILGPEANAQQIEDARRELGLDRPLHEQLLRFYARLLRGDLGRSYFLDRPVTQALWERAEPTLVLMAAALFVAVLIGVPSGIVAGAYQGSWWDRGLMTLALLGVCVPGFWLSLNFIYLFSVRLGWLPVAGCAVVTEIVFNIPGLGRLIISAILRRDYPVVQGVVLLTAAAYMLINLMVDVVYAHIDPRISYA